MERVMNLLGKLATTDIYKIDLISLKQASQRIWKDFSSKLIANCWRHPGFSGDRNNIWAVETESFELLGREDL